MGNGLGQSLFLTVTLSSGQEDRSASLDNHSFEAQSCEQFRRMVCFGGWYRTVISLRNGPDSHSLGQIHSLQVALCLVPEEWSRLKNPDIYSSMLEKNSQDSSWLMFYFLRADALPDLTDVSGRMAQMTQFIS